MSCFCTTTTVLTSTLYSRMYGYYRILRTISTRVAFLSRGSESTAVVMILMSLLQTSSLIPVRMQICLQISLIQNA